MTDDESGDRQAEVWGRYYARSLDLMTTGAPLSEVLEDIARFAETQSEGALASILLLSSDGRRLFHGPPPFPISTTGQSTGS